MIILLIDGYFAVQSVLALFVQRALFCPCGRQLPWVAGLCRSCYRAAAHSRQRFAGLREEILERDGRLCRGCQSAGRLHVHHRQPGINRRELLVSVCATCHVRLHRWRTLRVWVPEPLVELWSEQHPGVPVQLQLPVSA
jgi:hypothetical protein